MSEVTALSMLADQLERDGWKDAAERVRRGNTTFHEDSAILAIAKALSKSPALSVGEVDLERVARAIAKSRNARCYGIADDGNWQEPNLLADARAAISAMPSNKSWNEAIEAAAERALVELPRERWSCADDESGTALTLSRQRKFTHDSIRSLVREGEG